MMLKEISFRDAMDRMLTGEKGISITYPMPIEKMTFEELLNLEKAGAKCLAEDKELERVPVAVAPAGYEPAIMIESMEDAPETMAPPTPVREPDVWIPVRRATGK